MLSAAGARAPGPSQQHSGPSPNSDMAPTGQDRSTEVETGGLGLGHRSGSTELEQGAGIPKFRAGTETVAGALGLRSTAKDLYCRGSF